MARTAGAVPESPAAAADAVAMPSAKTIAVVVMCLRRIGCLLGRRSRCASGSARTVLPGGQCAP